MQALLKKLNDLIIKIDLVDEKLDIQAPKGVMTEDLLNEIKLHKNDLIEFITLYNTKKEKHLFIPQVSLQSSYPLSSSQRRLWLLSQFESGNTAYNMPSVFELKGNLDVNSLNKAFHSLIERHESLRTNFIETENGEARQVILESNDSNFQLLSEDLSYEKNYIEEVKKIIENEVNFKFNLISDSLLRAKLVKTSQDTYVFICVMHHIISDGWSAEVMTTELFTLYAAIVNDVQNPLPVLPLQYKDYACWQQEKIKSKEIEIHKLYWLKQFEGELSTLDLPTFHARPLIKTYNGKSVNIVINEKLFKAFNDLCKSEESTLFMGLLAVVKLLLYKYTNQTDIVIGSPTAGREHADLQNQIGFYINTLALRTRFADKNTFKELLANVKTVTLGAYEHQIYPFDELVIELPLKRDMSRNPLFDVMISLQNRDKQKLKNIDDILINEFRIEEEVISKFDMDFAFHETEKGLELTLTYNTDIYSEVLSKRIIKHFETVLSSIVQKPEVALNSLNYLTAEEKHQLLFDFNNTAVDYPKNKTIIDLFEEQVEKTPNNIAVVFEQQKLTYSELNEQANQLARYLRKEYAIEPEDLIGIRLERSESLIVSILGVLKSGAAYVPIDTNYPQQRIDYIEKDSNSKMVVDENFLAQFTEVQQNYSKSNIDKVNSTKDLAYIIYTSGTTGNPKGVMVEHGNTVELINWSIVEYCKSGFDIIYAVTSHCFDLSIYEFFYTLSTGKKMRILKNALEINHYLAKDKNILLNTVPSVIRKLIEDKVSLENVKLINMAGEILPTYLIEKLPIDKIEIRNLYGPSEDTTYSTYYFIENNKNRTISIGRPISNTQVLILDEMNELTPLGVSGKIFVSGAGLSRGYLNKPELTAEKFIDNPFVDGAKMYDTGDMGRWLPDGNIEFLGRKDFQVKIRGHRIELGEIETNISQYSKNIKQVVTDVREVNGEKTLAVYYTTDSKTEIDKNNLRAYLQGKLPDYMMPSFFIELDNIPLTPNGKIDRKALPSITGEDLIRIEYIAPRNETEQKLVEIWQEVLGVEKIGITDNFFELGGHSLIVAQAINRIHQSLAKQISFKDFFANPTIKGITKNLTQREFNAIPKVPEQESYPLTSSQQRLWILSQLEGGSQAYNMPAVVVLKGELNHDYFEKAFQFFIDRHEITRTSFKSDNQSGEIRQYITPKENVNFKVELLDFTNKTETEIEDYLQITNNKSFNLEGSPLLKASLLKRADNEYLFFLSMHHIIGDGWSTQVLISEVVENYNNLLQGYAIEEKTASLSIQYKDYAVWLQEEIKSQRYQKAEAFWLEQFKGELPVLDLPNFKKRPLIQTYNGNNVSYLFSKDFTDKLKKYSEQHGATLFMSLMAGVKALLYRYTRQQDIIVGTPMAGREHPDLENQIGLYLNTLAIRTRLEEDNNTFKSLLEKEKEILLSAYEHQMYPFDELVGNLNLKRKRSRSALFDVMVVFQNQSQLRLGNTTQAINGLEVGGYDYKRKTSQFDVSFAFAEEADHLGLTIEYNTDIYDEFLINRMFSHFEKLLTQAIEEKNGVLNIEDIDFLTEEELYQLLIDFNDTKVDYPKDKTIIDLFEEQVAKTPNNVAVVFENIKLTYKELNEKANQLGLYLRGNYQIVPDDLVAIKLERSEQIIVSILGILKSGAAYVPIDPEYPQERIQYIEQDTNAKIVIDEKELEKFYKYQEKYSKDSLEKINESNNLAYVIYTSGTTGNPKGVMVEHRNVIRLVKPCSFFPLNEENVLLSTGSISFDATIIEYFGTLLNGSKLILTKQENLLELDSLTKVIQDNKVNSLWMTASWFNQVIENKINVFETIYQLIVGGDIVSPTHISKLFESYPNIKIVNGYGPTENTTFSTTFEIKNIKYHNIPIGIPISNSMTYILDELLNVVPIGIVGKIYVSGDGVARGYLNKAELTKQKFIENPFIKGERMYDTGDLARWLPDGNIEYLGRIDHQVKIRGYRIELGEIETNIFQFSQAIKQVVANVQVVNGEKMLAVYYTTDSKTEIDKITLLGYLQGKLPDYMVPGFFKELETIPLTSNGKIDRNALPSITVEDLIRKEYIAPTNETEQKLVEIWQEVLGVEKIGITDNFFELGGHSLHTLQVINKVNLELNYTLSFKDIFKTSTIKELAQIIKNEESELNVSYHIPKSNDTNSTFELSPSQKRLWITAQLGGSRSFNIPFVFDVFGEFNLNDFESAIIALLSRHNVLRTSFRKASENVLKQYVASIDEFNFYLYVDEVSKTKEEIREYLNHQIQGAFDLENGPLLRAGVYKVNDQHHVVYLVVHHLITDGWSMEVIFQEIYGHYMSIVTKNKLMTLKPLDIQYTDYADWLQKNLTNITEKERPFWHKKFEKELPLLQLPFERKNRPLRKTYEGSYFNATLQKNETKILKDFSAKFGVTTYASLLSIFKILLYKYSNISELCIGLPVSGRFNNQIEHQVGLYVNTLPIRTKFDKDQTFKEIITNEGKSLIDYYDNSFFQMDDLLKELNIKTHNGRTPLFDIMLVHQNQTTTDIFTENNFLDNVKFESWENPDTNQTQYDITISFWDVKDEMVFQVYYNSDVYEQQHLEVVIKDYIYLIKNIIHYYDIPIDTFFETTSYSFLTDGEIIYEKAQVDNSITRQEKLDEALPQDSVLKGKLHDILKASLGKDLSFNDDYFEAGGSSLSAIELVENINEALHEEYSILDFYENASVSLFHNYIQRKKLGQVEEKEDDFVINFTKHITDESKPNIILFPPILGEGILFKGLSNSLEQDLNVYAVNMPIIDATENVLQKLITLFKERLKSIIVPGKVNYILGYSIGVNFAYEVATHFEKEGIDIEMFLIDRHPIDLSYEPTTKIIKEMIGYNKPLIDRAKQMGIDENILHQRIEQNVKAFSNYKLEEKTNIPIYTFESEAQMEKWKNYTSRFKGVEILKGTHLEALNKENIDAISQTIKNTIRIS